MDDADDSLDPDAAFTAVSDPTRVAVVRALADHRANHPEDPALSFAQLRKAVDVRDSGRFLYHLKKLLGVFVEKVGEGDYRLTYAGEQMAAAIRAGVFTGRVTLGPTELDSECPICGTTAVGTFEDGHLAVTCGEDHRLLVWRFPPNAGTESSVPELAALATARIRHEVELATMGTCGTCFGAMSTTAERTDSPVSPRFRAACDTCGGRLDGPLWYAALAHPETAAFYSRHGRSIRGAYLWEFDAEVRETPFPEGGADEPPGETHHVVVTLGGESLHVLLDGDGRVVRTGPPARAGAVDESDPE